MTHYQLAQMALRGEALRMRVHYLMIKAALAKQAARAVEVGAVDAADPA